MQSTTQRTLKECRRRGWIAAVAEKWNQNARRGIGYGVRQDLFGWIDVIALAPGRGIIGIQTTSAGAKSAHLTKLTTERRKEVGVWLAVGGIAELWCWVKRGNRYELDVTSIPGADVRMMTREKNPQGVGVGLLDQWLGS